MTQVVKSVAAGTDDAHDTINGNFPGYADDETFVYVGLPGGNACVAGFRFLDVNIPAGATIDGVSLQLEDIAFEGDPTTVDIGFEDAADPATFSAGSSPVDRTMTTARESAFDLAEPAGTPPQLQTISEQGMIDSLQEVIDTHGAVENVVLLIASNGATTYNPWRAFDAGTGSPAQLTIDYTEAAGGEAAPVRRSLALLGVGR